jgi:hypothetical protein
MVHDTNLLLDINPESAIIANPLNPLMPFMLAVTNEYSTKLDLGNVYPMVRKFVTMGELTASLRSITRPLWKITLNK